MTNAKKNKPQIEDYSVWVAQIYEGLYSCEFCPRRCRVNRLAGKVGFCGMSAEIMVSSYGLHFGEESELVGKGGSGTIFFTGCTLGCVFCQNFEISQARQGQFMSLEKLVAVLLDLQQKGALNINFVSPTHFTPQVIQAVLHARRRGLTIPIVYNCSGYERVGTLRMLKGIVDIYMPDAKFSDPQTAKQLCGAEDYYEIMTDALREMHRQVGDLQTDDSGRAVSGLLVRHLVLPDGLAGSEKILRFIASEISPKTYVNIMDQYHPVANVSEHTSLNRTVTPEEFAKVIACAKHYGLSRGFQQLSS